MFKLLSWRRFEQLAFDFDTLAEAFKTLKEPSLQQIAETLATFCLKLDDSIRDKNHET